MAIPDAFFGSFSSDSNDNFDEYMAYKNVPWVLRKAILLAGHSIAIKNLGNGRYQTTQSMMGRTAKYEFGLDEKFTMVGMDGIEHKMVITMEGSSMVEWHTPMDKPNQPVDKQVYSIEGGKLVQSLSDGKVSAKRFFKRKN
ncbi:hypothetical protein PENTCL1PPCAC_28244 [Pristionchus entomophagus]|uniref:Lipocalin/cytosolic fatty-acid binding domain-containing protein n=1 Tax=Pristionchus entomophagus TaxID=358040 RepID=A0AAV5UII6_9BILA|nr:hypothetical protein PENTCL1PPCAC_28244 [Pristionchus entomophagus]